MARAMKVLHVDVQDRVFRLSWRDGNTVVATSDVPKVSRVDPEQPRYAELGRRIFEEWQQNGLHRDASDPRKDRAVLHTRNSEVYAEVVAVLDALRSAKRKVIAANSEREMPVFDVSFAVD